MPRSRLQLPAARFCVEDIDFIPVSMPIANYVLSMIHDVSQLINHSSDIAKNPPSYWETIKHKLDHFNVIEANIIDNKYKNEGQIMSDIDCVWKRMYELSSIQHKQNTQHDPKSGFITFAAAIESQFYNLWDEFERLLVKKHYLKETTALSSTKTTKNTSSPDLDVKEKETTDTERIEETTDLKEWLTNTVGLAQYYDVFVRNGFDDLSFVVGIITMDDLEEMEIDKLGHRRKILTHADQLLKKDKDKKKRRFGQVDDEDLNQERINDYQEPQRKRRKK
eukprot:286869_1